MVPKTSSASLGRRIFGSKWTGCMLFNIIESQYLDEAHMRCYALASPYTFVICSVGPVADRDENNCISVSNILVQSFS